MKRSTLYRKIADELGIDEYHTAEIRTIEDARKVWTIVAGIDRDMKAQIENQLKYSI